MNEPALPPKFFFDSKTSTQYPFLINETAVAIPEIPAPIIEILFFLFIFLTKQKLLPL